MTHPSRFRQQSTARRAFSSTYDRTAHTAPLMQRSIPLKVRLIVLVLLACFISGHVVWTKHVSAEAAVARQAQQQLAASQARRAAVFTTQVQSLMAAHPELSLSVAVSAAPGQLQQLGDISSFDAASTGKLVTAADLLHHVDRGQISLSTMINGQTVEHLLRIMIINSDDTAWAELNGYLTHENLQTYADSIGLTAYDAATNSITATDITTLLQKLYNRQLLTAANRTLLLSYLSQANYRNFIVPAIPAADTVYHKIGIDADSVHDAAIIVHGSKSFELTIFSDGHGTYNWQERKIIMQAITRDAMAAYL